jgi:hypothetical protein
MGSRYEEVEGTGLYFLFFDGLLFVLLIGIDNVRSINFCEMLLKV